MAVVNEVSTLANIPQFVPFGELYYTQDTGNLYIGTGFSTGSDFVPLNPGPNVNIELISGAGGLPAGFNGDIQYNNNGVLGGSAATVTAAGSINIPVGQVYEIGGVPLSSAWSGLTGAMLSTQVAPWYNATSTVDSGISRLGAASLAIGNGTNGDFTGALKLTQVNIIGSGQTGAATSVQPLEIHNTANGIGAFYVHSGTAGSAGNGPTINFCKSDGTQSTPTAIGAQEFLAFIDFRGYDGVAYGNGAQIAVQNGAAWTTGLHSCTIEFLACPAGSTTLTEVFRMNSNPDNGGDASCNASALTFSLPHGKSFVWNASDGYSGVADTNISRLGSASIAIGNGTEGDYSGSLKLTAINLQGLTVSELVATDASNNLVSITALPNGTTATTQAANDNSTKVATTAYVATAIAASPASAWSSLTGTLSNGQVIPYADAGISRLSAASLAIGNGTNGDYTGSLTLGKLFAGDGTIVGGSGNTPSIAFRTGTDTGFAHSGSTGNTNQVLYTILDGYEVVVNDVSFGATICETQALGFSAGAYTSRDLSLSRLGAGVLGLGNGVYNDASGQLNLRMVQVASSGTLTSVLDNNGVSIYNGNYLRFSGGNVLGTVDAGITRLGAASLAIGNGTAGDTTGEIVAAEYAVAMKSTTTISSTVPVKMDTSHANQFIATTTADTGAGIVIGIAAPVNASATGYVINSGIVSLTLGSTGAAIGNWVIVDPTLNGAVKCTTTYPPAGTIIGTAMSAVSTSPGSIINVLIGLK